MQNPRKHPVCGLPVAFLAGLLLWHAASSPVAHAQMVPGGEESAGEEEGDEALSSPESAPPSLGPKSQSGDSVAPPLTAPAADSAAEQPPFDSVLLQGLNKVTARAEAFSAPLGTVSRFGNLEIIARGCWQSSPEEQPENAVLMEVWELRSGEGRERLFLGWMFSSSPAISALEHPVYDITVLSCQRQQSQDEAE